MPLISIIISLFSCLFYVCTKWFDFFSFDKSDLVNTYTNIAIADNIEKSQIYLMTLFRKIVERISFGSIQKVLSSTNTESHTEIYTQTHIKRNKIE